MQDNKDIAKINEQFTDLGWEKMQGILDKEMPVTPIRKPWWRWLWLLLFLGILAGGTYYNFAIKNITPPNEIPDRTIANTTEQTIDNTKFEEKNKTEEKILKETTSIFEETINPNIQPDKKATNFPKNIIKNDVKKNIAQNNLRIKEEDIFIEKKIQQDDSFVENKVENTSIIKTTVSTPKMPINSKSDKQKDPSITPNKEHAESTLSSAPISVKNEAQNSWSTEKIATLSPLVSKTKSVDELSSIPVPKTRKFSQQYSVLAGVRSDEFNDFGGFNTGFLAHYRFTPKVGLETGLVYTNIKKSIDTYVDYTEVVNREFPQNTEQFSRTITDMLSLHYLWLPLHFTYRPHYKIQLSTGLNTGYRLREIAAFTAFSESEDFVTTDDDQPIGNTYESSFESEPFAVQIDTYGAEQVKRINIPYSFSIRSMDVAIQTGIRYYPIPRLGIDLNYQYGLTNMTNNSTINRNSGLQLALIWQLHR